MSLYFNILLCSVAIPFVFSFDRNLQFYKKWKYVIPSIIIVGAFYIACDAVLTKLGVWGFNENYHSNFTMLGLPIEEWLFFIFIPYACIFIHEVFVYYFPNIKLSSKASSVISIGLLVVLIPIIVLNITKWYTAYILIITAVILIYSLLAKSKEIGRFYLSFLIIIIPFTIVNGLLTGSFIPDEVVWYNDAENLGIRIGTIPIEDFFYAFTLILITLFIKNYFKRKLEKYETR